jgi:hypothetical protein
LSWRPWCRCLSFIGEKTRDAVGGVSDHNTSVVGDRLSGGMQLLYFDCTKLPAVVVKFETGDHRRFSAIPRPWPGSRNRTRSAIITPGRASGRHTFDTPSLAARASMLTRGSSGLAGLAGSATKRAAFD